jgi:hypothetical protein
MNRWWGPVLALLLLGLAAGPAFGSKKKQEQIAQLTVKAEELQARDAKKVVIQEIGLLRAWLAEAQAYLVEDEEDELKQAMDRATAQARLIGALLDQVEAEDAARKAHEKADAREKQVLQTRNEAFELERKKSALEKEGL